MKALVLNPFVAYPFTSQCFFQFVHCLVHLESRLDASLKELIYLILYAQFSSFLPPSFLLLAPPYILCLSKFLLDSPKI